MSEDDLKKLRKSCPVNLVQGENRSWNLEINQGTPECGEVLRDVLGKMGPEGKKYLVTRLKVEDPELRKVIDESQE
jgi:hypothetical protein